MKKVAPTSKGAGRKAAPALNGAAATSQSLTALEIEISAKRYAQAKGKAKQRGCTVEEYITSLIVEDTLCHTLGEDDVRPAPDQFRLAVSLGAEPLGVINIPAKPSMRIRARADFNHVSLVDALACAIRFDCYPGCGGGSLLIWEESELSEKEVREEWPLPAIDNLPSEIDWVELDGRTVCNAMVAAVARNMTVREYLGGLVTADAEALAQKGGV